MDLIEACRKFIAIDSTPGNGSMELARFAADLCQQAGLNVELQVEMLGGLEQANVIARPVSGFPDEEILLQTHLDTVDPGNYALWTKTGSNPFNASIYQNALYGLGSADVKLDFICKLKALETFHGVAWKVPPVLVGTFGEESGMVGAVKLIRKKKIRARRALVGEATDMKLIHAMKGFATVEIVVPFSDEEKAFHYRHANGESMSTRSKIFVGKAAHSADPKSGDSAISKMLDYMSKLPEGLVVMEVEGGISSNTVPAHAVVEFDMVGGLTGTLITKLSKVTQAIGCLERDFQNHHDGSFDPPFPTLNIGMVRTREDHVILSGCCRLTPSIGNELYRNWMDDLHDACVSVGASFRVTDYKQPFRTPASSEFVLACQAELSRQGMDAGIATQSSANEANIFSRFGIECVVIGPGRGAGNSHAPDEHVRISRLEEAIRFYSGVIERVCI